MNILPMGEEEPWIELIPQSWTRRVMILRNRLLDPDVHLGPNEMISSVHELRGIYRHSFLKDIHSSVARKFDDMLWDDCFRRPLTYFGKCDKIMFDQAVEEAVGFYCQLIEDTGNQYNISFLKNLSMASSLPMPYLKSVVKFESQDAAPFLAVQSCLVHIADLLVFQGKRTEASKMYEKSVSLNHSSGQPYLRLAQLQETADNKSLSGLLTIIYYYIRCMGTGNQCDLHLQTNVEHLLIKTRVAHPSSAEENLIHAFLQMIEGIVLNFPTSQLTSNLESALNVEVSGCLSIERLSFEQLFRVIVISLWIWKIESDKRSVGLLNHNEGKALNVLGILFNAILSVGYRKLITDITHFPVLGHINILLEWMRMHPHVIHHQMFTSRLDSFALCTVADRILPYTNMYAEAGNHFVGCILPEEKRLLGFLPLTGAYEHLQYILDDFDGRCVGLRVLRFSRLIEYFSTPNFGLIKRVFGTSTSLFVPPAILYTPPTTPPNIIFATRACSSMNSHPLAFSSETGRTGMISTTQQVTATNIVENGNSTMMGEQG